MGALIIRIRENLDFGTSLVLPSHRSQGNVANKESNSQYRSIERFVRLLPKYR